MKFLPRNLILAHIEQETSSVGVCRRLTEGSAPLAQSAREDKSMFIILAVLGLVLVIVYLPRFGWFQEWTAITGWIPFFKNVLGW